MIKLIIFKIPNFVGVWFFAKYRLYVGCTLKPVILYLCVCVYCANSCNFANAHAIIEDICHIYKSNISRLSCLIKVKGLHNDIWRWAQISMQIVNCCLPPCSCIPFHNPCAFFLSFSFFFHASYVHSWLFHALTAAIFCPVASASWQLNKYADGHLTEQTEQRYQTTTIIITAIITTTTAAQQAIAAKPNFYELRKFHYERFSYTFYRRLLGRIRVLLIWFCSVSGLLTIQIITHFIEALNKTTYFYTKKKSKNYLWH